MPGRRINEHGWYSCVALDWGWSAPTAVALADAGWDTATLSRGTWGTLARIHRAGDDLHRMTGTGIDEAARVMAAAASSSADPVGDTTAFASKGEAGAQWS